MLIYSPPETRQREQIGAALYSSCWLYKQRPNLFIHPPQTIYKLTPLRYRSISSPSIITGVFVMVVRFMELKSRSSIRASLLPNRVFDEESFRYDDKCRNNPGICFQRLIYISNHNIDEPSALMYIDERKCCDSKKLFAQRH